MAQSKCYFPKTAYDISVPIPCKDPSHQLLLAIPPLIIFAHRRGYFLIIDCLVETLDQRLLRWRRASTSRGKRVSSFRRSVSALATIPSSTDLNSGTEVDKSKTMDDRLNIGKPNNDLFETEYYDAHPKFYLQLCKSHQQWHTCTNTP